MVPFHVFEKQVDMLGREMSWFGGPGRCCMPIFPSAMSPSQPVAIWYSRSMPRGRRLRTMPFDGYRWQPHRHLAGQSESTCPASAKEKHVLWMEGIDREALSSPSVVWVTKLIFAQLTASSGFD